MLDTKIDHDCGTRRCSAACEGYHFVSTPTSPSLSTTSKAATGAAPEVSQPPFNFLEDLSVFQLAKAINLNLSGIVKPTQKSLKEPITDTKEQKEAIKTAQNPKTFCRKEQLLAKAKLLEKQNALRRQLLSQHAALARAKHALQLCQHRTKLYTAHKFQLGSILSCHQPFLDDALAEVKLRRQHQASAAASASHLHLVNSVLRLAPAGKYVNLRPTPPTPPSPTPLPPSNRSLWRQHHKSSWTPAPFPFQLESYSAPRTRVVHVHHYQESVVDSEDFSEYESVLEDEYIQDNYHDEGDCYEEDAYYSHGYFYGEEEIEDSNSSDSDFCGEDVSDFAPSTSFDEDSSQCSGYDGSSY